ncbi:rod shape-determining protein MreC [uncultured Sunxiuqinia sp.]|uniref:rod shape-determining protein MreC n=1 Tax=uncultured Sunxiuqinia sp. TaxID=1573825 RepID=UPI002AA8FEDC|nr:rod shape-determining protein MreC [uncultured Sunxiuqinia sp.]
MRSLLQFLARNSFLFLFLALEVISMTLIVNYNNFQRVKFLNSSNRISASIYKTTDDFAAYFNLRKENEELAEENARLRTELQKLQLAEIFGSVDTTRKDTTYQFIPARVINNSANKQYNYLTINKGALDGIEPDMGIIGPKGVVGVVTNVTDHYSSGPSLLNKRWRVSAKIKKNAYFGSLSWDGTDYQYAQLNEIPFHVELARGDTIITSGYSSIFPEGILLGVIDDFNHNSGANFYQIKIKLSSNFKTISNIELVKKKHIKEQEKLEILNNND